MTGDTPDVSDCKDLLAESGDSEETEDPDKTKDPDDTKDEFAVEPIGKAAVATVDSDAIEGEAADETPGESPSVCPEGLSGADEYAWAEQRRMKSN